MWIKQENELSFTASNIEALSEIPKGNWLLKYNQIKGFFLERTPEFKFPKKIYGDSEKIAARYLNTFSNQNNNLGVLLTGLKGTGKSVTAKLTCGKSNLPVILITEPFTGDGFKSFLSNISQEAVIFIDEFEKVYFNEELQNSFLSILDGIFEGKKMFIFTSNEKNKINHYMINRPGRVHYLKEYDALDSSIINDVINDNLKNKANTEGLLEVLNILSNVTMDMLISLIKEMNLYDEQARESIRFLNLRPERTSYDFNIYQNNIRIGGSYIDFHPLTLQNLSLETYAYDLSVYSGKGASNHDEIMATLEKAGRKNSHPLEAVSEYVSETMSPKHDMVKSHKAPYITQETKESSEELPVEVCNEVMNKTEAVEQTSIFSEDKKMNSFGENTPSGHIRFDLRFDKCKVEYKNNDIIIFDEHGTKFVFKKRTYYVFSF